MNLFYSVFCVACKVGLWACALSDFSAFGLSPDYGNAAFLPAGTGRIALLRVSRGAGTSRPRGARSCRPGQGHGRIWPLDVLPAERISDYGTAPPGARTIADHRMEVLFHPSRAACIWPLYFAIAILVAVVAKIDVAGAEAFRYGGSHRSPQAHDLFCSQLDSGTHGPLCSPRCGASR